MGENMAHHLQCCGVCVGKRGTEQAYDEMKCKREKEEEEDEEEEKCKWKKQRYCVRYWAASLNII